MRRVACATDRLFICFHPVFPAEPSHLPAIQQVFFSAHRTVLSSASVPSLPDRSFYRSQCTHRGKRGTSRNETSNILRFVEKLSFFMQCANALL